VILGQAAAAADGRCLNDLVAMIGLGIEVRQIELGRRREAIP
jgi:hypothetical protein